MRFFCIWRYRALRDGAYCGDWSLFAWGVNIRQDESAGGGRDIGSQYARRKRAGFPDEGAGVMRCFADIVYSGLACRHVIRSVEMVLWKF